jgi:small subunit ribosomal protein S21|tara:strand:+ start:17 stop:214 length:198 start_codon:yes stop_codon:yes gene_type:complete
MLIVKLKKGENINRALKQFKQKVRNTKLIRTIRENQYFEKPSQARRKQKMKAIRVNKWKIENGEY